MGFLDRLAGRAKPNRTPGFAPPNTPEAWKQGSEWMTSWGAPLNIIVGEQHRQRELRELAACTGRCLRLVDVRLQPEPDNAYDSNAVAAYVNHLQVGYLKGILAAQLADGCASHGLRIPTFVVAGVLRGGWDDDASIGAHVWIDRTLTPGPQMAIEDAYQAEVGWPPSEDELDVLTR